MGWIALAVVGLGSVVLLWACGLPRTLWMFAGSAVMLGAAGYALQGSPMLPGHPVKQDAERREIDQGMVDLRHQMFGHIVFSNTYFVASDALLRSDKTRAAVRVMLAGIHESPRDAGLWTGLGLAYQQHDGEHISPAGKLAFERAMYLAPDHPGPPFFYGLALVRAGEFAEARRYWQRALALTPADAPYREGLAVRVALLDRLLGEATTQR